jgi:hypothetical protein
MLMPTPKLWGQDFVSVAVPLRRAQRAVCCCAHGCGYVAAHPVLTAHLTAGRAWKALSMNAVANCA